MSTRSFIHVQRTDGKWARIYCHSDGYWEHNGTRLQQFYNSQEKAEALVALGDISYLGETIGTKHNFDFYMEFYEKYANNYKGMASDPEFIRLKRMCNVYGRDRGEKNVAGKVGDTLEEVFADEEFMYVWRDGQWFGMCYTDDLDELRPLKDILAEEAATKEAEEALEEESLSAPADVDVASNSEPDDDASKPVWAA